MPRAPIPRLVLADARMTPSRVTTGYARGLGGRSPLLRLLGLGKAKVAKQPLLCTGLGGFGEILQGVPKVLKEPDHQVDVLADPIGSLVPLTFGEVVGALHG